MVYCEQCGAANDIMNQQCHRCGHHFVPVEPLINVHSNAEMANVGANALNPGADLETAAGIGAGLQLPEWLQRAAATTPEAPTTLRSGSVDMLGSPFTLGPMPDLPPSAPSTPADLPQLPELPVEQLQVAPAEVPAPFGETLVDPPMVDTTQDEPDTTASSPSPAPEHDTAELKLRIEAMDTAPQPQPPTSDPLSAPPSLPGDGLSATMPEWLRTGQHQVTRPVQAENTDTRSFISENDLPEWIRQIGAADVAKQVEADRVAAQVIPPVIQPPVNRTQFPGETKTAPAASNPWLSRKEGTLASDPWSTPARSRLTPPDTGSGDDERPEVIIVNPEPAESTSPGKTKRGMPSMKMPKASKSSAPVSVPDTHGEAANSPLTRYALMAAIALLLIAIIFMFVI